MKLFPQTALPALVLVGICLLPLVSHAQEAGYFDHVFEGRQRPVSTAVAGASWKFGEYSAARLVAAEPGAAASQHPQGLDVPLLAQALSRVRTWPQGRSADGPGELLFNPDEASELAQALAKLLQTAQPRQDVVFMSAARRGGLLLPQLTVTGRVFLVDETLHLLVQADRSDAVPAWRQTRVLPQLAFGSRSQPGPVRLQAEGARPLRPDWLVWPLTEVRLQPGGRTGAQAPEAGGAPVRQPASPPSAAAAAQMAPAELIAQRLRRLQLLREQGLITEAEYQAQRARVLAEL